MASNRYIIKAVVMGYSSIFAIVAASKIIDIFHEFCKINDIFQGSSLVGVNRDAIKKYLLEKYTSKFVQNITSPISNSIPYEKTTEKNNNESSQKNQNQFTEEEIKGFRPDVTFADIKGHVAAKKELESYVNFFSCQSSIDRLARKMSKGCILLGPSGHNRTLLARGLAGQSGVPLFEISYISTQGGFYCNRKWAKSAADVFKAAKEEAPCIVVIENLDSHYNTSVKGMRDLLIEMDKCHLEEGIVILAAVSNLDELPKDMFMWKRFGYVVEISRPDSSTRKNLLKFYLSKVKHDNTIDVDLLASVTCGMTLKDIRGLIRRSQVKASMQYKKIVTMQDICYVFLARKLPYLNDASIKLQPLVPPSHLQNSKYKTIQPKQICSHGIEPFFCRNKCENHTINRSSSTKWKYVKQNTQ